MESEDFIKDYEKEFSLEINFKQAGKEEEESKKIKLLNDLSSYIKNNESFLVVLVKQNNNEIDFQFLENKTSEILLLFTIKKLLDISKKRFSDFLSELKK